MPWHYDKNGSGIKLAVNVTDLMRIDEAIRPFLLGGKISQQSEIVQGEPGRGNGGAVVFDCDLLTAAACCDVIRQNDRRAKEHPTRVYLCRASVWERVPGHAVLTVMNGGRMVLNPAVFGAEQLDAAPGKQRIEV